MQNRRRHRRRHRRRYLLKFHFQGSQNKALLGTEEINTRDRRFVGAALTSDPD